MLVKTDTSLVLFNALSVEISMDHRECKESLIYIMSLQHNQSFSVFGSAFGDDRETSLFVRQDCKSQLSSTSSEHRLVSQSKISTAKQSHKKTVRDTTWNRHTYCMWISSTCSYVLYSVYIRKD